MGNSLRRFKKAVTKTEIVDYSVKITFTDGTEKKFEHLRGDAIEIPMEGSIVCFEYLGKTYFYGINSIKEIVVE